MAIQPLEQPQQVDQSSASKVEQPLSSPKRAWYTNPIIYIVLLIIVVTGGYFLVSRNFKYKSQEQDAGTVKYATGLPLDHVTVQLPNDEDILHYPLCQLTVPSVNVYLNNFEGLTVYRGTNLEPGLAESWTNPNPTTWRFKLRKGVKFHSGDAFTAQDVKFTIDQAKASVNEKVPWVSQPMAARIDTVSIIDDYTVELKTKEPDATLLQWLMFVGVVSKDQVTRDGVEKAVGTGPYKMDSLAKREASLVANAEYWAGAAKVKKLTYKVVPDPKQAIKELENGTLDIITLYTADKNDLADKGYQYAKFRTGGINWLFFDVNSQKSKYITGVDTNPFKDIRVRKAVQLALNIPELISEAGIDAEPVSHFATQELVGYNPELMVVEQDLSEAKRLMSEAGFDKGFTVTLDGDQQPDHVKLFEAIKKQLAEIGITVKPNALDTENYFGKLSSGDLSMLYIFYYPDTLDSLDLINTLFHTKTGSHGVWNVNNYSNPKVDSVIDEAESTFNVDERIKLTREAHALIMEDLSSLPLYTETHRIYSRDNITYKPSITVIKLGFDMSGRQKAQ